jgi:hypothetical protein
MRSKLLVAASVVLSACNSQPTPTPAQDPSPANSAAVQGKETVQGKEAVPSKQFGAAFTVPASEALAQAVARVGKEAASPAASGDAKGAGEHQCGAEHGQASNAAKGATGGKEVASCGSATSDESGKLVRVSGTVSAVCQKAGCWMSLQDGTAEARIFMKDHAFVVPKDIVGKRAEVEGMLRAKTVSAGFAKHLAEDGGKDPAKVEGPQQEFMVTAVGVRLLD